jgi:protein ImuB
MMPRVASLYLPNLATDRIRRLERKNAAPPRSSPAFAGEGEHAKGGGAARPTGETASAPAGPHGYVRPTEERASPWWPDARWPENAKERIKLLALRQRMGLDHPSNQPAPEVDDPRSGGWRPGAHWAKNSDEWLERKIASKRAKREAVVEQIEQLPLHQRPPMRELGRRSENLPHPFRAMPPDEAAQPTGRVSPYNLEGAFWQQGRTLGPLVAREVIKSSGRHPGESRDPRTLPLDTSDAAAGSRAEFLDPGFRRDDDDGEHSAPLVTTRRDGQRMVIAAACPAAQALGIQSAMPVTQARALVPGLDVRPAEPEAESAVLTSLALFVARRWTPVAAISDPAGLFLDLTGVAHLFGGEERMCRRILRFCARAGFSARIAVAGTAGAAHALARHAPGPITLCPSSEEGDMIAGLPLTALRIGEDVAAAARRLGIEQVGALADMPRAPLSRRFGATLLTRLDQALGRVPEPLDPIVPVDPPCASLRLVEPISTAEAIAEVVRDLMQTLLRSLEESGLAARALTLICLRVDGEEQRIGIGTARATRDGPHLLRLLCAKIEKIEPGFGIEAMRLLAGRCEPLGPQPIDGELAGQRPAPDIVPLVDSLCGRLGARCLYKMDAVESDVPERALRRVGPLAATSSWPDWARPVRLLVPAERVDSVLAELPDHPPRRFAWRGRLYRVARADGPERIYGEWWKHSGEADAVRDYFQIEDEAGHRFWLYRRGDGLDPRTGDLSWHMQGLFG